ncbi:hypothetical protein AAFF_G00304880 [Aldrovandia affinis]|uniref:Uncharacterized protein n=1 Tax=Aldrovandia affinis TaxID=143900 RepID=A0AAD7WR69_9TELE|nr:hypothetical protein AAFF_G00304880 [Aldrovandia affinis]
MGDGRELSQGPAGEACTSSCQSPTLEIALRFESPDSPADGRKKRKKPPPLSLVRHYGRLFLRRALSPTPGAPDEDAALPLLLSAGSFSPPRAGGRCRGISRRRRTAEEAFRERYLHAGRSIRAGVRMRSRGAERDTPGPGPGQAWVWELRAQRWRVSGLWDGQEAPLAAAAALL